MSREPFEAMPDVMDAKQIAEALQISKAGHTTFEQPVFSNITDRLAQIGDEKMSWWRAEKPHKQNTMKMQSRAGKVANQPIGQSKTHSASFGAFSSKIASLFQFKSWENL